MNHTTRPAPLAAAAGLLATASLVASAALAPATAAAASPSAGSAGRARPVSTTFAVLPAALSTSGTRESSAKVQSRLGGPAGVVVLRVGATSKEKPLIQVGSLTTEVAWWTSKVPVTVAALARSSLATTKARAKAASTRSDNVAASKLRQSLGSPTPVSPRCSAPPVTAGPSSGRGPSRPG